MRISIRRSTHSAVVAALVVSALALGEAAPIAASARPESVAARVAVQSVSADSAKVVPRSGRPELSETVPDDAEFLIAKRYGRGDSKRWNFRIEPSEKFTVAFACKAPGRPAAVMEVSGHASTSRCGAPLNLSVGGDRRERQWLRIDAPRRVRWVVAVYRRLPEGTSVS